MKRLMLRSLSAAVAITLAAVMPSCQREVADSVLLFECPQYSLTPEEILVQGRTVVKAPSPLQIITNVGSKAERHIQLPAPSESLPQAAIGMTLPDALYNRCIADIAVDSLAPLSPRAIYMAMALADPQRSMRSLRAIADSLHSPFETAEWLIAAAEVYTVTADHAWAKYALEVTAPLLGHDTSASLICGAPVEPQKFGSYLPAWMDAVDAEAVVSSLVNVVCSRAFRAASELAETCGMPGESFVARADALDRALLLQLWEPRRQLYSQMLYGAGPHQSPVVDNLANALAICLNIPGEEASLRMARNVVVSPYGIPRLWPAPTNYATALSGSSDASVCAVWAIAAARCRHGALLRLALGTMIRNAAVAHAAPVRVSDGKAVDTEVNPAEASAAYIAATLRVLFGISTDRGLSIQPIVPREYSGEKVLTGLRYRGADFTVRVRGTGSRIARFTVDGEMYASGQMPTGLRGHHEVLVTMAGNTLPSHPLDCRLRPDEVLPPTPEPVWRDSVEVVPGEPEAAVVFVPYINGIAGAPLEDASWLVTPMGCDSFTVSFARMMPDGLESFTSKPHLIKP